VLNLTGFIAIIIIIIIITPSPSLPPSSYASEISGSRGGECEDDLSSGLLRHCSLA
jgi:hypothetical protein